MSFPYALVRFSDLEIAKQRLREKAYTEYQIDADTTLFFYTKPGKIPSWVAAFREHIDEKLKPNQVYAGVLIYQKNRAHIAALFGSAHLHLSGYLDPNFPFELAESIANLNAVQDYENNVIAGSKVFTSTHYRNVGPLPVVPLEHVRRFEGLLRNASFGKRAEFGQSVHIKVPETPTQIKRIFDNTRRALRSGLKSAIPRVARVIDEVKVESLNRRLVRDFRALLDGKPTSVSLNIPFRGTCRVEFGGSMSVLEYGEIEEVSAFAKSNKIADRDLLNLHFVLEADEGTIEPWTSPTFV